MNEVKYAVRTDMGCYRENNEDNFYCGGVILDANCKNPFKLSGKTSSPSVFAIFDGMGGEADGEIASYIAAKVFSERFNLSSAPNEYSIEQIIDEYVQEANRRILSSQKMPELRMGTTMVMAVVMTKSLRFYNIGDSRAYVFQKNVLKQVSVDHTLAAQKIAAKMVTEEQIKGTSEWGKLTACIGIERSDGTYFKPSKSAEIPLIDKTRFLLCSDGITDMLDDQCMENIFLKTKTAETTASSIMSEALNNGGRDNATVLVVDISPKKLFIPGIKMW